MRKYLIILIILCIVSCMSVFTSTSLASLEYSYDSFRFGYHHGTDIDLDDNEMPTIPYGAMFLRYEDIYNYADDGLNDTGQGLFFQYGTGFAIDDELIRIIGVGLMFEGSFLIGDEFTLYNFNVGIDLTALTVLKIQAGMGRAILDLDLSDDPGIFDKESSWSYFANLGIDVPLDDNFSIFALYSHHWLADWELGDVKFGVNLWYY